MNWNLSSILYNFTGGFDSLELDSNFERFSFFESTQNKKPPMPGIFKHIPIEEKPQWNKMDTIVLSIMIGAFCYKLIENYYLTGDPFCCHPDFTGEGIYRLIFDIYDPTSELIDEDWQWDEESGTWYNNAYDNWHRQKYQSRGILSRLRSEIIQQKDNLLSLEERSILKKYKEYTTEDLKKLPKEILRDLRWARAKEYDKWLLFKKWKSKQQLESEGSKRFEEFFE